MIPSFPEIIVSDTDKQVLSALFGALLGALIGAFSTYVTSEHARKKQIQLNEIEKIRLKIKNSLVALDSIENNLHNILIMTLKNMGHYRDMSGGIFDGSITKFTMNMPHSYPVEPGLSAGLMNTQTVVQWTALETEAMLHNANLREFNEYYSELRTSVHSAQLTDPESLHLPTIKSDNQTISQGASEQLEACEFLRQRCLEVLSIMQLQLKGYKAIDFEKISLKDLKKYRDELGGCKITQAEIDEQVAKLGATYTEENAFKVNKKF